MLIWPLANGDLATPLPIGALRVAQVALLLTGVGVLAFALRAWTLARSRRILAALGWVLLVVAGSVIVSLAATNGLLLWDATY
ncbi:MAG: hypothetical protein Q4G43_15490 [Mobilicoccus sp.]|nr:hypothetical protein [Mobilicoccus sp.]